MPFPATWRSVHYMGASGRQGPDAAPCCDARIHCDIQSRQPARRTAGDTILFRVQCHHVLGLSEETSSPSAMEPAPCPDSGQGPVSPRNGAASLSCGKASRPLTFIPSALRPIVANPVESVLKLTRRLCMQSICSTARRSDHGCDATIGAVAKTKRNAAQTMRYYLSRSV